MDMNWTLCCEIVGAVALILIVGSVLKVIARDKQRAWERAAKTLGLTWTATDAFQLGVMQGRFEGAEVIIDTHTETTKRRAHNAPMLDPGEIAPPGHHVEDHTTWTRVRFPHSAPLGLRLEVVTRAHAAYNSGKQEHLIEVGDAAFDAAFYVISDTPEAALRVLSPALRQALLAMAQHGGGEVRLDDDALCWQKVALVEDEPTLRAVLTDGARATHALREAAHTRAHDHAKIS